jgi:hypothetical protein
MSQMRSRKASEAKPRSPTIQPGTSGRQSSRPGAIGKSCAWLGAKAKAMAHPYDLSPFEWTRVTAYAAAASCSMSVGAL